MIRYRYVNDKIIERELPLTGKVFVSPNDTISPSDIIGEIKQTAGFHIIDTAAQLHIQPAKAKNYILRKEGEHIFKGELVAEKSQMFSKETLKVYATADGTIQNVNESNGQVLIKIIRKQENIPSGVWGKVLTTENNKVSVQTQVIELFGKGGRGFKREGTIKVIAGPNEIIRENMIREDLSGRIIMGGSLLTKEAVSKAVHIGILGLVTGSMNFEDITSIGLDSDVGVTVLITEGYGTISMCDDMYKLAQRYDGFYSFIDGQNSTLTIPLSKPTDAHKKEQSKTLSVGSDVRIVFEDNLGAVGTVSQLFDTYTFRSGLSSPAAKITDLNKEYIVPLTNIEIIEV